MSRRFDFIASIIFALIGVFFVTASTQLTTNVIGGSVTPATFPKLFGSLLVGLSVLLLFETFKKKHIESQEADGEEHTYYRRFFIILAAMAAYILLIEPLGFVISTFLFLVLAFQTMERGQLLKSILIAAGICLVIHFVFIELLEASVKSWPSFLN